MKVFIEKSNPEGVVKAPPSKSMTHRLLILAALSDGVSEIGNLAFSEDVKATIRCLSAIGVSVETISEDSVRITGVGKSIRPQTLLDCGESGSTLRFMIPVCMMSEGEAQLTGSARLLQRPLSVFSELANRQGIRFTKDNEKLTVGNGLQADCFTLPGNISSQFVSGLLFVLPLLNGDSRILLTGNIESRSYIDMTLYAIRLFGGKAQWVGERELYIPGNQRYLPVNTEIEGDWSNAAFFYAMQYAGFDVQVEGLRDDSPQGDRVCLEHFKNLSSRNEPVDLSDCPDLGPVEFVFAVLKYGGCFFGIKRLRLKESDRVQAMAEELRKIGYSMLCSDNEVRIGVCRLRKPDSAFSGHNDHRIVMALAVLCCFTGGVIDGAESVNKSFPDFFQKLEDLKVKIRYET